MGSRFTPRRTLQKTPAVCEKNYPPGSRPAASVLARQLPGLTHLYYQIPPTVGFSPNFQTGFITLQQVNPTNAVWVGECEVDGTTLTWFAGFDPINEEIQIGLLNPPDPIARLYIQNYDYSGPWPQFDTGHQELRSTVLVLDAMAVVRWTL